MEQASEYGNELLLPIKEVAPRLGMSVKTMERRYKEGVIPLPEWNGGKRVYRESKIAVLIERITKYGRKL